MNNSLKGKGVTLRSFIIAKNEGTSNVFWIPVTFHLPVFGWVQPGQTQTANLDLKIPVKLSGNYCVVFYGAVLSSSIEIFVQMCYKN